MVKPQIIFRRINDLGFPSTIQQLGIGINSIKHEDHNSFSLNIQLIDWILSIGVVIYEKGKE